MNFEEIITKFAKTIGIEDIQVETEGCIFEFDGLPIEMTYDASFDRVVLMAEVGEIERRRQGEVAAKLSQLNLRMALNGGHTVAADLDTGIIYCIHGIPLAGRSEERFAAEVTVMVAKSKAARDLLGLEIAVARSVDALHVSHPESFTVRV